MRRRVAKALRAEAERQGKSYTAFAKQHYISRNYFSFSNSNIGVTASLLRKVHWLTNEPYEWLIDGERTQK